MAILLKAVDNWKNDINVTGINKSLPLGMYYYFVDEEEIQNLSGIIGNCNAIVSCWFTPLIEKEDLELFKIKYDTERFGKAVGSLDDTPFVYRIAEFKSNVKTLGKFKKYDVKRPNSELRDYRNESRLLNFPYSYALLYDNINIPLEIRYHEIYPYDSDNEFKISCNTMVSDKGCYSLFVPGLKGDHLGLMECMISSSPTEIPVSSSAYAQWSSTQKASTNQSLLNNLQSLSQANAFTQEDVTLKKEQTGVNTLLGLGSTIMSGVGSAMGGNIGGVLGSVLGGVQQGVNYGQTMDNLNLRSDHSHRAYALGQKQAIGTKNAMIKDLNNTPRTMMSTGSDVLFSLKTSGTTIKLYRYKITKTYAERLGDYFAMFGYKQNKVMSVNLRSRRDYNYIQTMGANITSKPSRRRIPKDHLRKLTEIFDNGITIWHIDRNKGLFQNYTYDNKEV